MSEITIGDLSHILKNAEKLIDKEIAPVVKRTALAIAETQRATVKRRSGRTADSIKATGPNGAPFNATTTTAEIGPTWFVGKLLELGTSHSAPQPFVAQSADPHMDAHLKGVQDATVNGALKGLTR